MDTSARPRTRNPARRGPLSTPQLRSSTHVPSSCRHWISCGIDGIVLCSRGTASCSLRIALLVYTINSAALHHVSGDEMMERCTACSLVANGKSAALIETSPCCFGTSPIGAARPAAVQLSLWRRASPRDRRQGEPPLCLVVLCGALLLGHCNY